MRRRRVLDFVLALAAVLALSTLVSSGCKRKPAPVRGRGALPVVSPYHPPPLPTVIWPTPAPGQPKRRPTLPG